MTAAQAGDAPPGPPANGGRRRLPDRDQPHFQKKKMVVLVTVGVLILLAMALLLHTGGAADATSFLGGIIHNGRWGGLAHG